uniref:Uncharacterized protein n=1 Tax=Chromera velia CCMP2878 TaxID=1169474 RepID=A0A0G4IEW5_9ALVE|eukprot:Cvel_13849.t1-p1 / transcript=Cvel_13849.t1 / gene=Cvel_13849 / organism=Chromera_velia_CCMP2878 / gene_product=Putative ankyrin repeat protein RF_0381, putative / transcript_product=Putative ankyrin repeat protein RF_0381, putative / location=Cvel_scaffold962:31157-32005(-) / protein_length=283 / sequence_SO=supercontig / SO=protein_coding / is_pseudo=false
MMAVESGSLEAVQMLREWGAGLEVRTSNGTSALHRAYDVQQPGSGHEIVEFLVSEGVDVNAVNKKGETLSPLSIAVKNGRVDLIEYLIMQKAHIHTKDKYRDTPLHKAARHGHREAVGVLLNRGARVNEGNNKGETPLFETTDLLYGIQPKDDRDVAQILISRGANANAEAEGGVRILHWVAGFGSPDVVELLLDNGAELNVTDSEGRNALHFVTFIAGSRLPRFPNIKEQLEEKKLRVAKLLIAKGINVHAMTNQDESVRTLAEKRVDSGLRTFFPRFFLCL